MTSTFRFLAAGVLTAAITTGAAAAEPYAPTNNNEVLETLPRSLLSSKDVIAPLRKQLAAEPTNADVAHKVAQHYLRLGNQEGDPRFFGYARAAIKPWWDTPVPPGPILRLRAKLQEKDHLYDLALRDLRKLVQVEPRNSQAWIEIANILRVQGKYDEANLACDTLGEFAGTIPITICRTPIQAVTGQAQAAYDAITADLPLARQQFPSTVHWMVTMQAKLANSLGHYELAEEHFREGLSSVPDDAYMLRDYADFLLDRRRHDEALDLLREHTNDNGILLRAAIAARRCGDDSLADQWQAKLKSRFEEIRLRGGEPHGRFEARYSLELDNNPTYALNAAAANWKKQKETRDTRNVLEGALAAKDRAAAAEAIAFVKRCGNEDVVLLRLIQQLEAIE